MFPDFANGLDTRMYDDHRAIKAYPLKRSRLPIRIVEDVLKGLDMSRKTLGDRINLENEAAVQLYIHPIPNIILSLFHGRLTNLPEHLLKGGLAARGKCEFTITFNGRMMLLFIELKHTLMTTHAGHSDVIAQVMAEADGADCFNKCHEFDGIPIHCILTDGISFEFYFLTFHNWVVLRGVGKAENGISWVNPYGRISLPASERSPDYVGQLKIILEIVFDTFLQSYEDAIYAQRKYSERRARMHNTENGTGFRRRPSTNFWDYAYDRAIKAHCVLRHAHTMRVAQPEEADVIAEHGLLLLKESAMVMPHPELDWSLLDSWSERKLAIQRI